MNTPPGRPEDVLAHRDMRAAVQTSETIGPNVPLIGSDERERRAGDAGGLPMGGRLLPVDPEVVHSDGRLGTRRVAQIDHLRTGSGA